MHGIELSGIDLSSERQLIVIGGVHGAGKSTFCRELLKAKVLPYLTPEELKIAVEFTGSRRDLLKELRRQVEACIHRGQSFYFEHVMSGHYVGKLMAMVKEAGYGIHLVYIDIATPELASTRINQRIKSNGHDVEREKVLQRLHESRSNFLTEYRDLSDSWDLYDNSGTDYLHVARCNSETGLSILHEDKFTAFERNNHCPSL